jgi:RNA polymerase sigma-70 factor (family 1)
MQMPIISLDKLREGDTNAFKCLFNHLYPELFLFANSIILDAPAAEDIVTDTFVAFWIKRLGFNSFATIKSFLIITTKNSCFNHLDRAKVRRRAKHEIEIQSALEERVRLAEITRRAVVNEIFRIIKDLPPKCQKILIMVYSEGLGNEEIAEIMGISKNTVRNQKKRGIQILKDRLKVVIEKK